VLLHYKRWHCQGTAPFSWTYDVHYRVLHSPLMDPILSHINSVQTPLTIPSVLYYICQQCSGYAVL